MRFLILIIIIALIVVVYIESIVRSFKIKFDGLANVSFKGFDFNSLNTNQTVINARIKLLISFNSLLGISISNLNIKAFKNGILIAESTKSILENTKKINLKPNVENEVYQTFDFHINNELADLILKLKTKQQYSINYQASFKLFGFPINKSGIYNN